VEEVVGEVVVVVVVVDVEGVVVVVVDVEVVVVVGWVQLPSVTVMPPLKTRSGPIRSETSTVEPSVSVPPAVVTTPGARSTSKRTIESSPDATTRSFPRCTDDWFSAWASTGQAKPMSSAGVFAVANKVVDP
jgi:hypothetical protein